MRIYKLAFASDIDMKRAENSPIQLDLGFPLRVALKGSVSIRAYVTDIIHWLSTA